ncbi:MAG: hypothetical protein A2W85_06315 [Bacteroidetes bacterium GWF2_41_31]|nr:MAG: hypothetical protein A2W85_06315 [Bacteroidetes bacterium GWF2_41_31]
MNFKTFVLILIALELLFFVWSIKQVSFTPYLYRGVILDTNWNSTCDTNSDTKLILIVNKLKQYVDSVDPNDTRVDTSWYHGQMIPPLNN